MRVWDCDPHVLATKHLNAQHAEVHWAVRCIQGDWKTRWTDVERFRSHPKGIQWLGVVHDITVAELQRRGLYKYHATPGPRLLPEYENIAWLWRSGGIHTYVDALETFGYPRTRLDQGTPWERDGVSFAWYRSHENDWTRALAREASGC
jgi:hypothetical protein